jgi:hypothetical protein
MESTATMATGRPDGISSRRLATALPEAILAGETCPGRWLRQDDIARLGEADCLCAKPFASSRLKALRAGTEPRCPVAVRALDEVCRSVPLLSATLHLGTPRSITSEPSCALPRPDQAAIVNGEHRLLDATRRRNAEDADRFLGHIRRTRVELESHPNCPLTANPKVSGRLSRSISLPVK